MMINPLSLFREAVKKYPKVKPLFGLLAAVALLIIVASARIGASYAVFGVLIILGFLVLLALAVGATQLSGRQIALPVLVLVWAVLILAIASISFLFTGYFFNWPVAIRPIEASRPENQGQSNEDPPSVLSTFSKKQSIPNGAIPESGALRISDDLLSGDRVHYANTSNYSDKLIDVKYIVLHRTESNALRPTVRVLQEEQRNASSHVLVDKDGTIVQLVPFNLAAWHCRNYNDQSIGVEVVGESGTPLPDIQLKRLVELLRALHARYPSAELVRHRDLARGRTDCPGKDFPFDQVRELSLEKGQTISTKMAPSNVRMTTLQSSPATIPRNSTSPTMPESVEAIFAKTRAIIADFLRVKPEDVKENDALSTFQLDELDRVELINSLEEEFNVEMSDEEVEKFQTVHDIVVFIQRTPHVPPQND